ncbi:MAG: hypothetical protein ACRCXT_01460 [Paraclostridium sp.]
MFSLLGAIFIGLGVTLLLSSKRNEQIISKNNSGHVHKGTQGKKNKDKAEAEINELKKSKNNAYSFIFAGICCILVEITTSFL